MQVFAFSKLCAYFTIYFYAGAKQPLQIDHKKSTQLADQQIAAHCVLQIAEFGNLQHIVCCKLLDLASCMLTFWSIYRRGVRYKKTVA